MNDPLLNNNGSFNLVELEKEQELLKQRYEALKQQRYSNEKRAAAPVWEEIDRITSSLSDKEFRFLQNNKEFQESSNLIQTILQREYMRIMRPVIEATQDGKNALETHLKLLKRLIKNVKDEADKRDALMNEYITQYSNMTWQEFIQLKNNNKKGAE